MMLITYGKVIAYGTCVTLASWIVASAGSLIVGICGGILACTQLKLSRWTYVIGIYSFLVKAIPAYVQILIAYFAVPALFSVHISGFTAATCALMICSSGYTIEIVRAGINAIAPGQWLAARALGYSMLQALYHIILPQAAAIVLPPLAGEAEQLLKSTSLLATIGVTEITRTGLNILSRELNPIPVYLLIAGIYIALSAILHAALRPMKQTGVTHAYR